MAIRLKIAEQDFSELQRLVLANMPREAGAFALAGSARTGNNLTILVRRPVAIPPEQFMLQHEYRLEVSAQAINGLASLCQANKIGAIVCHSHPADIPYSDSDDVGERRIFGTLHNFIPAGAPTASLLFWPEGVRGRVWLPDSQRPIPIDEIIVFGRHIRRIQPDTPRTEATNVDQIYSRQVLAFGTEGQAAIARIKVAIVGVGGTGSPVAEQLARLGVEDFVLVDPDVFEGSNITRVYGTFAPRWSLFRSRQQHKVALIARHLRRIKPGARVRTVPNHVALTAAARTLLDRDLIFLCTDDHWGRAIVNQLAYQYMIPVINLGTRIDSTDGAITAAAGVVDVLRPDKACLWCKQALSPDRIAAESMPKSDLRSRQREGYVEGIDTPAPSVISITTTLAGLAVTLFLQLVTNFMRENGNISRLNLQVLSGTVSRGTSDIDPPCVCRKVRGFGDLRPMSTQDDPAFLSRYVAGRNLSLCLGPFS